MRVLFVAVWIAALVMLLGRPASGSAQMPDSLAVVDTFVAAQNAADVAAALPILADDVVFTGSGGTICGKDQVRPIIERAATQHRRTEVVGTPQVAGDTVTVLHRVVSDENQRLGIDSTEYVDTFVVRDGKIVSISSEITPESQAKIERALGGNLGGVPAALPPSVADDRGSALAPDRCTSSAYRPAAPAPSSRMSRIAARM